MKMIYFLIISSCTEHYIVIDVVCISSCEFLSLVLQ
jgi:hypothetical protein